MKFTNLFRNHFWLMPATLITLSVIVGVMTSLSIDRKAEPLKEMQGKRVVIDRDTLTIVGYSPLTGTVKLSNGLDIDVDFAKTKLK